MHGQSLIRSTLALAAAADVAFVGIGEMDDEAPLYRRPLPEPPPSSRPSRPPARSARSAAGSSTATGALLAAGANARTASAPIPDPRPRHGDRAGQGPRASARQSPRRCAGGWSTASSPTRRPPRRCSPRP